MSTASDKLAEHLLALIRIKPGQPFDLVKLAHKLKVPVEEITAAAATLAGWDYRLKRRKQSLAFVGAPDLLTDLEISYNLETKQIGRSLSCYRTVQSTNDVLTQMAEAGAPHGTVVTSEEQTKGRGRLGRTWHSPPGTGIYISILLRPPFPPEKAPAISIMTALALADAIRVYLPDDVRIKWPNDVWIGGKKVAGILTELSAEKGKIDYIVVGIGINVNHGVGNFPEALRPIATSVRRALKRKVSRVELLRNFLRNFELEYDRYLKHGLKKSHARVREYSALIGLPIAVRTGNHEVAGLAVDIDVEGRLIIESDGRRVPVTAGEVTVVKR
jgi:BirA family biotin operon repressor/biotin-[acetyl-CoA-carboxylase] ligase